MTDNRSLELSLMFKEQLTSNLFPIFKEEIPEALVKAYQSKHKPSSRDKVYTPVNTLHIMLLSAVQEDKSYQHAVNLFSLHYESESKKIIEKEKEMLEAEQKRDLEKGGKKGRPKLYRSKMPDSMTKDLSRSSASYTNARKRLSIELINKVFETTTHCRGDQGPDWHGLRTYITDGTYLQLQDKESIRAAYPIVKGDGSYPQALLQVFIRQRGGQITDYALANRIQSELELVLLMLKKMQLNELLLADDLYNTYYNFCLIRQQGAQIIVPGKRKKKYTVVKEIAKDDEIVEIQKTSCPKYVSQEEWDKLPQKIHLRRISYNYPTTNGIQSAVLYTTILNTEISATDIVLKYATRWDVEITIREAKTLMGINVMRSKSPEMIAKELAIALAAYNIIKNIIAKSAQKADFSPKENIFQKYTSFNSPVLLDKKGRVFHHWSPGRYGKVTGTDSSSQNP